VSSNSQIGCGLDFWGWKVGFGELAYWTIYGWCLHREMYFLVIKTGSKERRKKAESGERNEQEDKPKTPIGSVFQGMLKGVKTTTHPPQKMEKQKRKRGAKIKSLLKAKSAPLCGSSKKEDRKNKTFSRRAVKMAKKKEKRGGKNKS
jgi:hypothetical protein